MPNPSNLTELERQTLYCRIMEFPYSNTGFRQVDGSGSVVYMTGSTQNSQVNAALLAGDNFLLAMSAATETQLRADLDAYDALGFDSIEIVGGTFAGISGVNYSSEGEQANIAAKIKQTFPFWRAWEVMAANEKKSPHLEVMS